MSVATPVCCVWTCKKALRFCCLPNMRLFFLISALFCASLSPRSLGLSWASLMICGDLLFSVFFGRCRPALWPVKSGSLLMPKSHTTLVRKCVCSFGKEARDAPMCVHNWRTTTLMSSVLSCFLNMRAAKDPSRR